MLKITMMTTIETVVWGPYATQTFRGSHFDMDIRDGMVRVRTKDKSGDVSGAICLIPLSNVKHFVAEEEISVKKQPVVLPPPSMEPVPVVTVPKFEPPPPDVGSLGDFQPRVPIQKAGPKPKKGLMGGVTPGDDDDDDPEAA